MATLNSMVRRVMRPYVGMDWWLCARLKIAASEIIHHFPDYWAECQPDTLAALLYKQGTQTLTSGEHLQVQGLCRQIPALRLIFGDLDPHLRSFWDQLPRECWEIAEVVLPDTVFLPNHETSYSFLADPTVRSVATFIYENHTYGEMPVLRDALQDAGCEHPQFLEHCLVPDHCHGCWLLLHAVLHR